MPAMRSAPPVAARAAARRARAGARSSALSAVAPALALALILALYWLTTYRPRELAYLDYVDGYYLYAAHRMAQGAHLYSQVMGVQPPGIYLVGEALFRIHDDLSTIRLYAAVVHSITVVLVYATARRLFSASATAVLAALIYSLAPYSLIWSRTFDPNPLVTCLSLATVPALLAGTRRGALLAGALGALALATKIWYLPVCIATLIYLAQRQLLPHYAATLGAGAAVIAALGTATAGAAFWQGMLSQDASGLSLAWLVAASIDVVLREWPLLVLAGVGLTALRRIPDERAALMRLYLYGAISVLAATIKIGTFAPVFQFAEPALALAAAAFVRACIVRRTADGKGSGMGGIAVAGGLLLVLAGWSLSEARAATPGSDRAVRQVVAAVDRASAPRASLLAPPFYLYLSGRRQVDDRHADVNLWERGAAHGDRAARAAAAAAVRAIRRGAIPLVAVDNRVAKLPGVVDALHARYRQLPFIDTLPSDRAVTLWVPKPNG